MGWIKMKAIQYMIDSADSSELNEISQAVLCRYDNLFTEEEVVFLSLPKNDPKERKRIIQSILCMENHRE